MNLAAVGRSVCVRQGVDERMDKVLQFLRRSAVCRVPVGACDKWLTDQVRWVYCVC